MPWEDDVESTKALPTIVQIPEGIRIKLMSTLMILGKWYQTLVTTKIELMSLDYLQFTLL